jgi:hypothetical protein
MNMSFAWNAGQAKLIDQVDAIYLDGYWYIACRYIGIILR